MNLDAQEAALGLLGLSPTNLTPTTVTTNFHSQKSTIPTKRKQRDDADIAGEAIDCICGFEVDDGFSIACDLCSRWCHSACFDVAPEEIPDQFKCWTCKPRPPSFKERAVRMQKEKLELGGVAIVEKQRRKASPGVDRKHRRVSVDKRKRRPSMVNEDEHVDIDEQWSQSYVHISQDIISDDDTRLKLRRQAQHWRGVTAVADSPPMVKELPPAALSSYSNPHILPPAYSLHTVTPIPSNRLITDYKSSITPSSSYLSDPLNAYAHLGMPKPFVHLFGPPLDVALDSRLAGNQGRFARSGCRPNAVLRPLLCDDSDNLGFGVFALRDLKANEEVVLGWEWDDGNAVHNLPALLSTPHIFPLHQFQHLRHQMSNILHALSSTFTTCACGARAQDCAINRMAAFVDGSSTQDGQQAQYPDLGPLVGRKRGFKTRERIPFSGGRGGMVMCKDDGPQPRQPLPAVALSPSSPVLRERSVKGKERAIDGDGDVEMVDGRAKSASRGVFEAKNSQATKPTLHSSLRSPNRLKSHPTFDLRPPDPGGPSQNVSYDQPQPANEDSMPPKMRKRWMHRELEALRELNGNTSPSSSRDSNHNHTARLSQSPGSSSPSGVSQGSPIIPPSKGPGLGITYNNGYGHDRPQFENERQPDHGHQRFHHLHHQEDDMLTNTPHHPANMPPPPMPASLDPTTISSTKSSINAIHTNQHHVPPLTTLIVPSISPLTSFANLSLLSPALLGSTPPPLLPSLSFPSSPSPNSGSVSVTTTLSPGVPPKDHAAPWSPLRRSTASLDPLSSTSLPSLPAPASSTINDAGSIASSLSSPTNPADDMDDRPMEYLSCTPSPPPSPSSFRPETLLMDTNNEIQSTPNSPDPTWRADSPSGDHINPIIESDIPIPISYDGQSPSRSEMLMKDVEEVAQSIPMNEEERWGSSVSGIEHRDHMGFDGSSSRSRSLSPSPSPACPDNTAVTVMDSCDRSKEEGPTIEAPNDMNLGQSTNGTSSVRLESITLDEVPPPEPSTTSSPLPQPLLPDPISSPQDSTTGCQQVVKEEESHVESSREPQPSQPPPPPAPKVKMSLRDFALRKKKMREEQEMIKSVQESSSSGGVDLPFRSDGGGGVNGEQVNPMEGKVDEQDRIVEIVPKKQELEKDAVDELRREVSCQGASSLSRPMVEEDVVDIPGPWMKPIATNGYHEQLQQPSITPCLTPSALLATHIPADTRSLSTADLRTKQEFIEQPIPVATAVVQPISIDTTRYAAMYNDSRSISPINPDPHHFQSYSPPRLCQEDGEIAEILDTPPPTLPPPLPLSLSTSSLPATPPVVNRSTITPVPSSDSGASLRRVPFNQRPDPSFSFNRSVSSSPSLVRHSPPTHPRSFKASPTYRPTQQSPPAPASTPTPASRGTGGPPTAPRALRQSLLSNRLTPTTPTGMTSSTSSYPPTPSSTTSTSTATPASSAAITTTAGGRFPPYIPRGPSADRDRGWDMDQMQYARSLSRRDSRESGHAWGSR